MVVFTLVVYMCYLFNINREYLHVVKAITFITGKKSIFSSAFFSTLKIPPDFVAFIVH